MSSGGVGIIYYTDNRLEGSRYEKVLELSCKSILDSGLPIVSCSLRPIDFGENIVLENRQRSYPTMALQILMALEKSTHKYIFFCEHDCLYHPSHFDFVPPTDDVYYYNVNNYRWLYGENYAITYSGLTSLSMMCCNRETAIKHYKYRLQVIEEQGLENHRSREPRWARKFGYEPGTKPKRRGGITDEGYVKRRSELPNIDIRHRRTFSSPKVKLEDFIHPPADFTEVTLDKVPGWDLRRLFNL
jgi:hypothetical protein